MGTRRTKAVLLAYALCLALGDESQAAAGATTRCTIEGVGSLSFGAYNTLQRQPLDSVTSLSFTCHDTGPMDSVTVQLSRSSTGGFMPRTFNGPSRDFEYNLYLDAGRTLVWGDGTAGTGTFMAPVTDGRTLQVPIFGRIAPRQNVRPGRYSDVIIVTLNF